MKNILVIIFLCLNLYCSTWTKAQELFKYNLNFSLIPKKWDEALPLGNGMLGALIWQNGNQLRFSLDRADLWDDRTAMDISKLTFKWVKQKLEDHEYDSVHTLGDDPYSSIAYPTKIRAAALVFDIASLGNVKSSTLDIATATAKIVWQNGATLKTFVHADKPFGAFRFTNMGSNIIPHLIPPGYNESESKNKASLANLHYPKGIIVRDSDHITYIQRGSNGFSYEVSVRWRYSNNILEGVWSVASYQKNDNKKSVAENVCKDQLANSYDLLIRSHKKWWQNYWASSSIQIPDSLLQKQYYLEMYKFGCVARKGAPPITLQAIWTADNGELPPWKGDVHNDLNTQLSYWPGFASNHLRETSSFTDWLWKVKNVNEKYTKAYFQTDGLNVPGVETISGRPMGGWIQYSLSPTISAWLAQYFYWQWKYSMDNHFLQYKAYPYLHDVALYLSQITTLQNNTRQLPLSSSPEYSDDDTSAWFTHGNTNYDIALMKFAFNAAAEVSTAIGKNEEANLWKKYATQVADFAIDSTGLMIAQGTDRTVSHRHHSNLIAIYPLGILNTENTTDKVIIDNSLNWLKHTGTKEWCGYSFSWVACLYARAKDGDDAAKALNIFAKNFCSPNSFHLNGDQKGGQYSGFTYNPFTLEGNFAFAQGLHEMLLQSYTGILKIFPAIPESWTDVSFNNLLAEGAFLISARKEKAKIDYIEIKATQGGTIHLKLPFEHYKINSKKDVLSLKEEDEILDISFKKNGTIELKAL